MKTYKEMIQYTVDEVDRGEFRYRESTVILVLAEAYGIDRQTIFSDIESEKDIRENARKEAKRAAHRASNEERRLANLAKKETT